MVQLEINNKVALVNAETIVKVEVPGMLVGGHLISATILDGNGKATPIHVRVSPNSLLGPILPFMFLAETLNVCL